MVGALLLFSQLVFDFISLYLHLLYCFCTVKYLCGLSLYFVWCEIYRAKEQYWPERGGLYNLAGTLFILIWLICLYHTSSLDFYCWPLVSLLKPQPNWRHLPRYLFCWKLTLSLHFYLSARRKYQTIKCLQEAREVELSKAQLISGSIYLVFSSWTIDQYFCNHGTASLW